MKHRARRAWLVVVLLLLASVGTASAEGAWVLWEQSGSGNRRVDVFRAEPGCQQAALREARSTIARLTIPRSLYGEPELKGTNVRVPIEFETLEFSYVCLPDTVDPRGPKDK
jgi:hypothetical protein